jgi:acetyl esterase
MTLHPQAQEFVKTVKQLGLPRLYTLSPEDARVQATAANEFIGPGPEVATVSDITIPVDGAKIAARVYRPEQSHATIVWFHGGGWVLGDLDSHDATCRILANAAECTVIAIDYRLAPEHQFPLPLEDCWNALTWIAEQHSSEPLVVGGDSAGGNLAAVCALRARDRGAPELALQVLVYPITDHDMATESYVEHGGEDTLMGKQEMVWFFDHYVPITADRDNPQVSPLRVPDLSNVAPAIVVTDEYDPLRDEGLAYAARLREAGVPVTAHHYEDMPHAFFSMVNIFRRGNEAVDQVGREILLAVDTPSVETDIVAALAAHAGHLEAVSLKPMIAPALRVDADERDAELGFGCRLERAVAEWPRGRSG